MKRPRTATATEIPEQVAGDAILGSLQWGDLSSWTRAGVDRSLLAYPSSDLSRHLVVVGAAGSGKTETLLKLAYLAAKVYGWRVIFLDAKGDPETRDRFIAAMRSAGVPQSKLAVFPSRHYDGWRGDGRALLNRLIEVSDFSEPYYREIAVRTLELALTSPDGPPGSSAEFLARLSKAALRRAWRHAPRQAGVEDLAERDVAGVANRYRAFFGALGGALDGDWAFEDAGAAYLLLEGLALKAEAARLGRYLLEDFAHFASARKKKADRVLMIVDEFSVLEAAAGAAHLFERIRSFGAAIGVSSQSYSGLGKAADRILDAAHGLIVHRCADPIRLVSRAGMVTRDTYTRHLHPTRRGASGTASRKETWRVPPDEVRQLETGDAVVISGGKAARISVLQISIGAKSLAAARALSRPAGARRKADPVPAPAPRQVPGL